MHHVSPFVCLPCLLLVFCCIFSVLGKDGPLCRAFKHSMGNQWGARVDEGQLWAHQDVQSRGERECGVVFQFKIVKDVMNMYGNFQWIIGRPIPIFIVSILGSLILVPRLRYLMHSSPTTKPKSQEKCTKDS